MERDVERDVDRTTVGKRIWNKPVLLLMSNGDVEIENISSSKKAECRKAYRNYGKYSKYPRIPIFACFYSMLLWFISEVFLPGHRAVGIRSMSS